MLATLRTGDHSEGRGYVLTMHRQSKNVRNNDSSSMQMLEQHYSTPNESARNARIRRSIPFQS